jgi:hypothetical protein
VSPAPPRIRLATPQDAPRISDLVRRCYGETYPDPWVLDPAQVGRRLEARQIVYALAEEGGRHVAQCALWPHAPGLHECGKAVVDLEQRGRGLVAGLSSRLVDGWAPAHGVKVVIGRAVTNHLRMQDYSLGAGYTPLGLLLGLLPNTFAVAGVAPSSHPVSILLVGRRIDPAPRRRRLTLLGPDLALALRALSDLGIGAGRARRSRRRPALGLTLERAEPVHQLHLRFGAGQPWQTLAHDLVEQEAALGTRLIWADVPAEHPQAPWLVDHLRRLGFGLGAYVPHGGRRGEDVTRLQCYLDTPIPADGMLLRSEAHGLRDEVLADYRRGRKPERAA